MNNFHKLIFILLCLFQLNCINQQKDLGKESFTRLSSNNEIVVINFWTIFCMPCLKELPYFENVYDSLKDYKEVSVNSVALNSKNELKQFLSKDTTNLFGKAYHLMNGSLSMPVITVYKNDGIIDKRNNGVRQGSGNEYVTKLLTDKYKFRGTPTTIIYHKNKEIYRIEGFSDSIDVVKYGDEYIAKIISVVDSLRNK